MPIETHLNGNIRPVHAAGNDAPQSSHAICGASTCLLRGAAEAIECAETDHTQYGRDLEADPEIRALARFGHEKGLMLDACKVESILNGTALPNGMEHVVRTQIGGRRVTKIYDPRTIDLESGQTFYKPADSVFDYLTDLMLANHFFDDDIRLEGFFEIERSLQIVISQPFVEGRHPSWAELVEKMEAQGMVHDGQGAGTSRFWLDGGPAGFIRVTDVHEDNVVVSEKTNWAHLIDVHFSLPGRDARLKALRALGIW